MFELYQLLVHLVIDLFFFYDGLLQLGFKECVLEA
jgi:hypothetical protein